MVVICAGLLVGYWLLMTFVPVPGLGAPSLAEPGHNLAHYLDERFLPGQHFEGTLLSTMAAVANCLIGIFAGLLLKNPRLTEQKKVAWLAVGGLACLIAGVAWSVQFPIIKLLWTSSYVLVACGCSALLLALFHQVIAVWRWEKWAQPFIWIGMNALAIYIICNIVNFHRVALRLSGGDIARFLGRWAELATVLVALALIFSLAHFLYRRKIFLRL
jgi:predicted acyltransferase